LGIEGALTRADRAGTKKGEKGIFFFIFVFFVIFMVENTGDGDGDGSGNRIQEAASPFESPRALPWAVMSHPSGVSIRDLLLPGS
jgi:hypothetical protein